MNRLGPFFEFYTIVFFLRFGQHRFLYRAPEEDCGQIPLQSLGYSEAIVSSQHPRMK